MQRGLMHHVGAADGLAQQRRRCAGAGRCTTAPSAAARVAECRQHRRAASGRTVAAAALRSSTQAETTVPPQAVQQAAPPPAQQRRAARSAEELKDPAHIGAQGTSSTTVNAFPGAVSLDSYMLLPVEQYFVLDPRQIRHLGANRFLLLVPRINILSVWLEPEVEISVSTVPSAQAGQPPKVVLQAEHCRIRGSDLVESLRLDQRFCMRFVTELTWQTAPGPPAQSLPSVLTQQQQQQQQQQQGRASPGPAAASAAWGGGGLVSGASSSGSSWDDGPLAPVGTGTIRGDAQLDVWCEVIPPFNLMPREVLQSTCNVVMRGLVGTLLPLFLRNLGSDYEAWATQPAYRASRAQRSKPLA